MFKIVIQVITYIIFTGIKPVALCETGLDLAGKTIGNVSDDNYFLKNSDKGKRFLGGPTCTFRGVKIPFFCSWSVKGGITAKSSCGYLQDT